MRSSTKIMATKWSRSLHFVKLLAILVASCCCVCRARPPNFVVFFADDLGFGDIGCYGHPTILTPNIDNLARNGMKFTQFYSAYPICTPSRSGLLTGRLPIRNGIFTSFGYPLDMVFRVFMPISEGGLPADEITIPDMLKAANYTSTLIGKWHLGHVDSLPTQRGFDEFLGLPYSQDEGCPPYPCHEWQKLWPGVPLYANKTIVEQPVNLSTLTPRYNEKALDFIESNKDRPFFLLMAYDEVHVPLFASNNFLNTSARGLFGDAAQEMDASVGLIVQKLHDLGLLDYTMVIFTSDNGAWTEQGLDGGSNGLLRGQKGETWEGGMRIPAIFYWPGRIQGGKVSLALGSHLDLLATFAELAQVELPNKTLDSFSLVPVLFNQTKVTKRETVFYYRATTLMAVRYHDYKAHFVTRDGWNLDPPEVVYTDNGPGRGCYFIHGCHESAVVYTDHGPGRGCYFIHGCHESAVVYTEHGPGRGCYFIHGCHESAKHDPPLLYHLGNDPSEKYPLNTDDYTDVLAAITALVSAHNKTLGPLPPAQLDSIGPTNEIAPCCNRATNCTCSQPPNGTYPLYNLYDLTSI